jgi:hypothetical protein
MGSAEISSTDSRVLERGPHRRLFVDVGCWHDATTRKQDSVHQLLDSSEHLRRTEH